MQPDSWVQLYQYLLGLIQLHPTKCTDITHWIVHGSCVDIQARVSFETSFVSKQDVCFGCFALISKQVNLTEIEKKVFWFR
jgi:hypothetical protein